MAPDSVCNFFNAKKRAELPTTRNLAAKLPLNQFFYVRVFKRRFINAGENGRIFIIKKAIFLLLERFIKSSYEQNSFSGRQWAI